MINIDNTWYPLNPPWTSIKSAPYPTKSSDATKNPNNIIKEFHEEINNLRMVMKDARTVHDYDSYAKLLSRYIEMINIELRI